MQSANENEGIEVNELELYRLKMDWKKHVDTERRATIQILESNYSAQNKICAIGKQLGLMNSESRLGEFLSLAEHVREPEVFWRAFYETWTACDATWSLRHRLRAKLRKWKSDFPLINPFSYLSSSDAAFFQTLPGSILIYRGASVQRIKGFAWTRDHKVALGFARGHRGIRVPNAVIARAYVQKKHIFFATNSRQESEVVVDFDLLTKVRFELPI